MTPQPEAAERFHYRAFALPLSSSFRLVGLAPAVPADQALSLELAREGEIQRSWSGSAGEPVWTTVIDGSAYTMELGRAGDHLMTYGNDAVFHLSADGNVLRCAPADRSAKAWQRFLLDTILWSVSLLRGVELLHASAVCGSKGVVAFAAFSGCGKTSLAIEMVRRGSALFADDILALPPSSGELRAYPGPPVMSVPDPRPGGGLGRLGEPLARFSGEVWLKVNDVAVEPAPVAAVCLLKRGRGAMPELRRLQATVLDLLPFTLGFSHPPSRMRERFVLFSRLAAEVPVYELSAPLDAPPPLLAELVQPLMLSTTGQDKAA